jgi:hypothetical protein
MMKGQVLPKSFFVLDVQIDRCREKRGVCQQVLIKEVGFWSWDPRWVISQTIPDFSCSLGEWENIRFVNAGVPRYGPPTPSLRSRPRRGVACWSVG